jgi:hypothetical protein
MIHEGILRYRGSRYLRWALGLTTGSFLLYYTQRGNHPPSGGTWQGYTLGTVGALLIVWLTMLGIRKRSYASGMGSVQGWTSAHVYLGLALLAVATLHSAVRFGWDVHTLAYILMCAVIASGIFGIYAYLANPRQLAQNSGGRPRSELFAELFELDKKGRELAQACDPAVSIAVKSSIERTTIGGGVYAQLFSVDRSWFLRTENEGTGSALASNVDQQPVIEFVADRVSRTAKRGEPATLQALVAVLSRRQAVLRRIRRDIRVQGWLRLWLYLHVPLTFALLAALIAHIVTTFLYW